MVASGAALVSVAQESLKEESCLQSSKGHTGLSVKQGTRNGVQNRIDGAGGVLLGLVGAGTGLDGCGERWHLRRPLEGRTGPGHAGMNGATFLEEGMAGMTGPHEVGKPWTMSGTSGSSWGLQRGRGGDRAQWSSMLGNSFWFLKLRCPSERCGG